MDRPIDRSVVLACARPCWMLVGLVGGLGDGDERRGGRAVGHMLPRVIVVIQ